MVLAIVLGGTLAVTLVRFRMATVTSSLKLALKTAFTDRLDRPSDLIREVSELARVVRKDGILGLESHDTNNEFLRKAIPRSVRAEVHYEVPSEDTALVQRIEKWLRAAPYELTRASTSRRPCLQRQRRRACSRDRTAVEADAFLALRACSPVPPSPFASKILPRSAARRMIRT